MGYAKDLKFLIGALENGMDFNTAFALSQQMEQERPQNKLSDLMADVGQQSMQGQEADPNRLSAYAQMMAPQYGVGEKGLSKVLEQVNSLGGGGGWDEQDDAAFSYIDPNGGATPMSLMQQVWGKTEFEGPDGRPDRAKIRQFLKSQFLGPGDDEAGFNAAVDRAYEQMIMTGSDSGDITSYQEALGGQTPGGGSQFTPGQEQAGNTMVGAAGYKGAQWGANKFGGQNLPNLVRSSARNPASSILRQGSEALSRPTSLQQAFRSRLPASGARAAGGAALSRLLAPLSVAGAGMKIGDEIGKRMPWVPDEGEERWQPQAGGFHKGPGPRDNHLSAWDRTYGTLQGLANFVTPFDGKWWS